MIVPNAPGGAEKTARGMKGESGRAQSVAIQDLHRLFIVQVPQINRSISTGGRKLYRHTLKRRHGMPSDSTDTLAMALV
jgi:hypothetical protein